MSGDALVPPHPTPLEIFHIGIIVDDLKSSMDRYGAGLGLEWASPRTVEAEFVTDDGIEVVESTVTYSTTPPVHIELAQATGPLYQPTGGPRMHHVGVWTGDVAASSARLSENGFPLHAVLQPSSGGDPSFIFHRDPGAGVFIELCDEARRDAVCAWVEGGR